VSGRQANSAGVRGTCSRAESAAATAAAMSGMTGAIGDPTVDPTGDPTGDATGDMTARRAAGRAAVAAVEAATTTGNAAAAMGAAGAGGAIVGDMHPFSQFERMFGSTSSFGRASCGGEDSPPQSDNKFSALGRGLRWAETVAT
jgi:hypothetical protein